MKLSYKNEQLPLCVLILLVIKALHLGFKVFFSDLSTTSSEKLTGSIFLVDSLVWLPVLVFFVYFYLYRQGRLSYEALQTR